MYWRNSKIELLKISEEAIKEVYTILEVDATNMVETYFGSGDQTLLHCLQEASIKNLLVIDQLVAEGIITPSFSGILDMTYIAGAIFALSLIDTQLKQDRLKKVLDETNRKI